MFKRSIAMLFALSLPVTAAAQDGARPDFIPEDQWSKIQNLIDPAAVSWHPYKGLAVKKDGTPLGEGYISLQGESHPTEFRKIEILNLSGCMDPKASNFKSYYVHAENTQCVFGGAAKK